jgi:hypothetical protein
MNLSKEYQLIVKEQDSAYISRTVF